MEQDSFTIKNGVTTVLLYPSFRAGEDTLTIEIPGLGLQTIPVKVSSANPYRVSLETPTNMLPEQSINAKAIVYDKRNNPVSKKTTLSINAIGDITVNDNTLTTLTTNDKGIAEFALKAGKIGGNHYLYGSIDGIAPKDQLRDSSTITTLAPQRKSNNLNAMYLLL